MSDTVLVGKMTLGTSTVADEHVKSDADFRASKMRHLHKPGTAFGFAIGTAPTAKEEIIFVAKGDALVRNFAALLYDTGTSTSVTFDLKKNGTTILSSVVTITHSESDKVPVVGTLASSPTELVAGDILSIALAQSSNTGAQGPFAWAEIEEVLGA